VRRQLINDIFCISLLSINDTISLISFSCAKNTFTLSKGDRDFNFNSTLKLRNVGFSYNNKTNIFNNVDITFKAGDFVGIIGESGSGKTTLFRLIARLLPPDADMIFIDDIDIYIKLIVINILET